MFDESRLRRGAPAVLLVLAMLVLSGCFGFPRKESGPAESKPVTKPNIVFVLTDDLSWKLIDHMPQVKRMQAEGVTFDNFLVADSLCCTSRATIFTGQYPHNTKVRTNFPPLGGYDVFRREGSEQKSFAPGLQKAGYRTAMLGKYMNGYQPLDSATGSTNVPHGWNEWYVAGNGYPEFGYNLNENGKIVRYGEEPQDYMTDVLAYKGLDFIDRSHASGQPFFMEVSTFAPHGPFVPAPRHAALFPNLKAPRTPSFNEADIGDKPSWLRQHNKKLGPRQVARIDEGFRDRVRMVQAVDEMLGKIRDRVKKLGIEKDTVVIFGSDNGFHMGEHRLAGGKMTPYTIDIRVPFVFVGPGIGGGGRVTQIAQNTDLAPTFLELAGAPVPAATDGRSLVPFLRGDAPADWRDTALVEHVKPAYSEQDPDRQDALPGAPTTYNALRTTDMLYVEYADGEREYYDLTRDPHHLTNIAATLAPERRRTLTARLYALTRCAGASCAAAGRSG
ncbi:sulfatase [Actinomadura sp. CNU-125]|uniref:sulfatase family protein n=1 Tax=Actinomadura sp. CNU-125 TaxID=1904961 RepID=UPI0021CC824D|nr:sulfatase [Actinomadura sp. CNU-125]